MAVRKRGDSWQVDLRTAEGTRFRRSYPTQEAAAAAEEAIKPNPQQRAALRKQRRKSVARSTSTSVSPKDSSANAETNSSQTSQPPTLLQFAQGLKLSRIDTGESVLLGTVEPSIVCFDPPCAPSARPSDVSEVSPSSSPFDPAKLPSAPRTLKKCSLHHIRGCSFASCSQETQDSGTEPS